MQQCRSSGIGPAAHAPATMHGDILTFSSCYRDFFMCQALPGSWIVSRCVLAWDHAVRHAGELWRCMHAGVQDVASIFMTSAGHHIFGTTRAGFPYRPQCSCQPTGAARSAAQQYRGHRCYRAASQYASTTDKPGKARRGGRRWVRPRQRVQLIQGAGRACGAEGLSLIHI